MARVVKTRAVRKREIVETARRFFFQHGYEDTTIQDIIDTVGIAKGTFYHYFRSKMDLLDEMVELTANEMAASLRPAIEADTTALEKFNALFKRGIAFKMENIDVFLVFLSVLFKDENAVVRDKLYRSMVRKHTPLFQRIIEQGIEEGSFRTPYPEDAAELMMKMGRNLNESICRLFLSKGVRADDVIRIIERKVKVYQDAIEKILGVPEGSLEIIQSDLEEIARAFFERLSEYEDGCEEKERAGNQSRDKWR